MFIDEHSVWPREEPAKRPQPAPSPSPDGPARLFLFLALTTFFLPFSIGSAAALIRYVAALFSD